MQRIKVKISSWYQQQPFFAKTYTIISLTLSILFTFDLISSFHLFFTLEDTFWHFNFWRPFTALIFLGKINFTSLINCFSIFLVLQNLQKEKFGGESYPEFIWLIIVISISCITVGTFLDLYFLTQCFIISLMLVCAFEKQQITFFDKNISLQLKYRILFVLFYGVVMGLLQKRQMSYLMGGVIGLIYLFIRYKLKKWIGRDLLLTPVCLQNWWLSKQLHDQSISS